MLEFFKKFLTFVNTHLQIYYIIYLLELLWKILHLQIIIYYFANSFGLNIIFRIFSGYKVYFLLLIALLLLKWEKLKFLVALIPTKVKQLIIIIINNSFKYIFTVIHLVIQYFNFIPKNYFEKSYCFIILP